MFDKFQSLFRGQVKSAVIEGSEEGLTEAATGERVKAEVHQAVVAGVQDALDELHLLLEKPAKTLAETNGHNRLAGLNGRGKRSHATTK